MMIKRLFAALGLALLLFAQVVLLMFVGCVFPIPIRYVSVCLLVLGVIIVAFGRGFMPMRFVRDACFLSGIPLCVGSLVGDLMLCIKISVVVFFLIMVVCSVVYLVVTVIDNNHKECRARSYGSASLVTLNGADNGRTWKIALKCVEPNIRATKHTQAAPSECVRFMMGSDPSCDMVLNDFTISRRHAAIKMDNDRNFWIQDLGSRNGTFVNGVRSLSERGRLLHHGDVIGIAYINFRFYDDRNLCRKPVIYLYPTVATKCSVKVLLDGDLTCVYPQCGADGWRDFTAAPDGTLTFPNGMTYYCLFWEGMSGSKWDFAHGYCIEGRKTGEFLAATLMRMGMTERETNEMIIYWLPRMQNNAYNVIAFQGVEYTDAARLEITPQPDSVLRVFMVWYASDCKIDIPSPVITPFERVGFTVVEWGGTEVWHSVS